MASNLTLVQEDGVVETDGHQKVTIYNVMGEDTVTFVVTDVEVVIRKIVWIGSLYCINAEKGYVVLTVLKED